MSPSPPLSDFRTCMHIPIPLFPKITATRKDKHRTVDPYNGDGEYNLFTAHQSAHTTPAAVQTTVSAGPSSSTRKPETYDFEDVEDESPKHGTRAYRERELREKELVDELGVKVEKSLDQRSSH